MRIDCDTLRRREFGVRHWWRRDVAVDLSRLHATDAHAAFAAGIVRVLARCIFGLGIGRVGRQRSTGYDLMGATNMPAPKSRRRRVAEIGARLDPAQPLSSQRSNTQTWSSGSTLDVVRGRSRTRHVSPLHSRNDRGWMPPLRNKPLALVASRSIRSRPRGPLPVSFVCSSWSS